MLRLLRLTVAAALVLAARVGAQEPEADSADVRIFSGSFTAGSREFARMFLQKGQVYRAEVSLGQVSFVIRPRRFGGEVPATARIRGGPGSGESVYEIYPFADDEYEVIVQDFPAGETATLTIYRDIRASRRRQGVIAGQDDGRNRWSVGLEFGVGHHGDYHISQLDAVRDEKRGGIDMEGCLMVKGARTLWGCAIGVSVHRANDTPRILWFFSEPRFRVRNWGGRLHPEFGVLVRGALGTAEDQEGDIFFGAEGQDNPAFFGAGGYLRLWLGSEVGKGPSIGVSLLHALVFGTSTEKDRFTRLGASVAFSF